MSSDLDTFFNTDEFARDAFWQETVVPVVFFDSPRTTSFGNSVVQGTDPYALGKAADFVGVAAGQTILLGTRTFTIRSVKPDATETVVRLKLRDAEP